MTVLGRVSVGIRQPLAEGQGQVALEQLERVPAAGDPDLHVVDRYEVRCGDEASYVYLDMYHCTGDEKASPPAGFSLAAAVE